MSGSTVLSIFTFAFFGSVEVTELHRRGYTAVQIGSVSAIAFGAILAMTPLLPAINRRFAARSLYLCGKALLVLSYPVVWIEAGLSTWLLSAALGGVGAALLWPLTESMIATLAPAESKGAYTGIYQTLLGLAYALGPALPSLIAITLDQAIELASAVALISIWPGLLVDWRLAAPLRSLSRQRLGHPREWGVVIIARAAPSLAAAALLGGLYENGLNAIGILGAQQIGWGEQASMGVMGVIGLGSLLVQYPLGRLADRIAVGRLLRVSLWILGLAMLALIAALYWPVLVWPLAFVWGAAGGGLYTLGMTAVAQRFVAAQVMMATSLLVMLYNLGAISGPALGGWLLDQGGVALLAAGFATLTFAASLWLGREAGRADGLAALR